MSASAPRPTSARPLPRPGSASQRPPSAAGGQGSPPGTTTRVRYRGDRDAQGLPHGEGTLVTDRVVYKGEFQHGKFHGKGSMNRLNITMSTPQAPTDGSVAPPPTPTFELVWSYVGDFDNMKRHGYGKLVLGSQQISELSYPEAEYLLREAAGLGSASGQPAPASSSSSSPPADAIPSRTKGTFTPMRCVAAAPGSWRPASTSGRSSKTCDRGKDACSIPTAARTPASGTLTRCTERGDSLSRTAPSSTVAGPTAT